jgi:hypothetical protein
MFLIFPTNVKPMKTLKGEETTTLLCAAVGTAGTVYGRSGTMFKNDRAIQNPYSLKLGTKETLGFLTYLPLGKNLLEFKSNIPYC